MKTAKTTAAKKTANTATAKKAPAAKTNAEAKPGQEAKKPDAKAKPEAKAATANIDRFGNRVGTKQAELNARITAEPKTMRQLMDEAGLDQTLYNHINRLVAAGHVAKTDEGHKLAT